MEYEELVDVEFRRIKDFPDYAIGEDGTVLKAVSVRQGEIPLNKKGKIQVINPYYANRDNELRVNLFRGKLRRTPDVRNLVAEAFIHRKHGYTIICKNGDYRNCQRSNLMQVRRGEANLFKRTMFGENRYNDFYKAFLQDPRPQVFYGMPIDVQQFIVDRGVVEWVPKILKYQ